MFQRLEPIRHPDVGHVRHANIVAASLVIALAQKMALEAVLDARLQDAITGNFTNVRRRQLPDLSRDGILLDLCGNQPVR